VGESVAGFLAGSSGDQVFAWATEPSFQNLYWQDRFRGSQRG